MVIWALLYAGLTNAHVHAHLCFDGLEEPVAVHVAERGEHLHEHSTSHDEHDDVDVDVLNQALAKAFKHDLNALAPSCGHTLVETRVNESLRAHPLVAAPKPPQPFLRPPLRAPPNR